MCSADSLVVDFIMSAAGAAFLLSLLSVKYLLSTKTVNLSNGNKESRPKFLSTSDASQSCQKMPYIWGRRITFGFLLCYILRE